MIYNRMNSISEHYRHLAVDRGNNTLEGTELESEAVPTHTHTYSIHLDI